MAINFVSTTYANGSGITSLTIDLPGNPSSPTAPRDGQFMILAISFTAFSGSDATVSGWTALYSGSVTGYGQHIYYKQGDGIPGTAIIQFDTGVSVGASISLFDGLATVSPIDVSGRTSSLHTVTHPTNSITTTVPGDLLFGVWGGADSSRYFGFPGDMAGIIQLIGLGAGKALTTSWSILTAAGATGSKIASSFDVATGSSQASSAIMTLIAVKAFNGPTTPVILTPADAETITVGRTYTITWTPATDPVVAQSALQYHVRYSINDGLSWVDIAALTSAGATSQSWNTTAIAPSTQARMEVRAFNGTTYSPFDETGRFILAADVTPNAPVSLHGEQPSGTTVTTFDRLVTLSMKGTFSDLGDVMTGFQIDWGTDGVTYGTASGTISSAVLSLDFGGGTFAAGLVYFRCRTKDTAGTFGPYAFAQLTAASAPAAPNITSPTSGSPPTAPLPTLTWTSTGQVSYRIRLTSGGVTVYNGSFVSSSATSVLCPLPLLNLTVYTFTLDYKDSSGLTSPADIETFLVTYAGPAKPTISVS